MMDLFIVEKKNSRNVAVSIDRFHKGMKTDCTILDKKGKKIIKSMDINTFKLKFG